MGQHGQMSSAVSLMKTSILKVGALCKGLEAV